MTVVTGFSVLSGNSEEIISPSLALSLKQIIAGKMSLIDLNRFRQVFSEFLAHTNRTDNPHNTILADIYEQLIDLSYAAYLDMATTAIGASEFSNVVVSPGAPLLELVRRVTLNSADFFDGEGPRLTGVPGYDEYELNARVHQIAAPVLATRYTMQTLGLVQNTGGTYPTDPYYLPLTLSGLPFRAGTLMLRMSGHAATGPYAEKPLVSVLDSNGEGITLTHKESTGLALYGVDTTNFSILTPSVQSQMQYFFSTIVPSFGTQANSYAVSQIAYDPIPGDVGALSLSPLRFRSDGQCFGVSWDRDLFSIHYTYAGHMRTITMRASERTTPFTTLQLHIPMYDPTSPQPLSVYGLSLYPQRLLRGQAAAAAVALKG